MNDRIKAVFICSPFKANSEERRAEYRRYAQEMALSALNDEDALARRKGILAGIEFLTRCDALWLCTRYGISNGMRKEISAAQRNGIRIIEKK